MNHTHLSGKMRCQKCGEEVCATCIDPCERCGLFLCRPCRLEHQVDRLHKILGSRDEEEAAGLPAHL